MIRRALACAVVSACVVAVMPVDASGANEPPAGFADVPCTAPFFVRVYQGDPNTVLVRAVDMSGSLTGTITAYGTDRTWTATIERAGLVDLPDGGREASLVVRADAPIEGIAYAPAWAPCTFRAGTLPNNSYVARDTQRPILVVGNQRPLEPAGCATPYVAPTVVHAVEPATPQDFSGSAVVRVAVALDPGGAVRSARVIASPSKTLIVSAVGAAARSEYTGGIPLLAGTGQLRVRHRVQLVKSAPMRRDRLSENRFGFPRASAR